MQGLASFTFVVVLYISFQIIEIFGLLVLILASCPKDLPILLKNLSIVISLDCLTFNIRSPF